GFVLHFDGTHVTAIDGREVAPQTATEDLFWVDGKPMPFAQAMVGGRAVGVPGLVKALEHAHQRHGSLPWATLFEPAMALASQGFAVSPRLHQLLQKDRFLRQDQQAAALYYLDDGNAVPVGHWLTNRRLAEVLKRLAREGSAALYDGPIAQRMVQAVRQHATNPGYLQHQDLQAYKPRVSKAMCFEYTSKPGVPYTICGMPPPSSGTLAVAQILGISRIAAGNRDLTWLAYLEAARLSFADRALYVADPAFVPAPAGDWLSLLTPGYLQPVTPALGGTRRHPHQPWPPCPSSPNTAPPTSAWSMPKAAP
ncbi:MAG: gamma-glutamyltransferase, partial [Burkholderiaceae bacterium]